MIPGFERIVEKRIQKAQSKLILKLNSTRNQDARFDMPQQYEAAIADRK